MYNSLQVLMLNSTQRKIIVGVSRACLDDPKAPKIGKKFTFLKKNVFFYIFYSVRLIFKWLSSVLCPNLYSKSVCFYYVYKKFRYD
jgi:hypothetical protein